MQQTAIRVSKREASLHNCVMFATDALVHAYDVNSIDFIKSFIDNERKPTHLILNELCWPKSITVKLYNEIIRKGRRVSSTIKTSYSYQNHGIIFLLDLDCPRSEEAIQKAISKNLFGSPYRWLVLSGDPEKLRSSGLWETPALPDSDLVLAERSESGFTLTELHRSSKNSSMVSTPRGYYDTTLVDIRPHREMFRRRRNMMRSPLTMSNVVQDSNSTMYHLPREDRLELQYDVISKTCWINVHLAFQMLNATPRYIFNQRWGYKYKGKWSGMINDLHIGKADVGTNCLGTFMERFEIVTYTDMLAPFHVSFILRQPPLSYVSNIFSLPFSSNVWIATAVCSILAMFGLYITSKIEARGGKTASQLDGTMGDAFLLTMSAVSQQGCVIEPRKVSGRIIVFIFFTVLMALYAAYSANIVVLLQAPSNSIKSLAQLIWSKIPLAAHDVDYNHIVFSTYKDPLHTTVYRKVDPEKGNGQFYAMNEGVERIRQGLFAFHSIAEQVYRRIEQTFLEGEKCDLVEIDFLNRIDPLVPMKKGSPYLELFKVVFKQLAESGIRSAIIKRMLVPKPQCSGKMAAFSSVGLMDLKPVLLLMVYGAALSLTILFLEIAHHKLQVSKLEVGGWVF
ncbi:probable glutamate receptor [Achroia grisella]|uniref:probable glutamate receptor n=1 Tax=Achroia grisella TaxID=688607 RepID=UPI0027D25359|nr:probable glutamate receptor [Achroia grisella]